MKLAHALASGSLLAFGSAIDPKRATGNPRHIENESAKSENDVERFLFDAESMSMAATGREDNFDGLFLMGGAKSGKGGKGDMDFFFVGHEECVDADFNRYDSIAYVGIDGEGACLDKCGDFKYTAPPGKLIGLEYTPAAKWCLCLFEDDYLDTIECPEEAATCSTCPEGKGEVMGTEIGSVVLEGGPLCYRYGPPGLKPSSFTDFNEDGSLCLSSTGLRYESIRFLNIETDTGLLPEPTPFPFNSPEGCAVECRKAGIVNFVGLFYEKGEAKFFGFDPVPIDPVDVVYHECHCLLPDGAADCSGYPYDDFTICTRRGGGTGPVSFTVNKDLYISEMSDPPFYSVTDTSCTRNDNFDPTEPTLGAKFPGQRSKAGKGGKGAKKGLGGDGGRGGRYYDDDYNDDYFYYDDFYYF